MIKHIPGLIAAITAFLAIKLSTWVLVLSFTAEALLYLFIYVAVTLVIDAAMRRYT